MDSLRNTTLSTGFRWLIILCVCVCVCVCRCRHVCVWSALKRMYHYFRGRERWNSSAIVVYSRSITCSPWKILLNHIDCELTTSARSNITACDPSKRQHLALNRLQSHIFETTVGLHVGYSRGTHTYTNVLVVAISLYLWRGCVFSEVCWHAGLTELSRTHVAEAASNTLDSMVL